MKNIYLQIPEFNPGSIPLVLATVISTTGSTPQKAGSSALFSSRGLICGTVGGGVLEARVQKIAIEAALKGESGLHHFDLSKDIIFTKEAICGGHVEVLVDASLQNHRALFRQAEELSGKKIPFIMVTFFSGSAKTSAKIERFIITNGEMSNIPAQHKEIIQAEAYRLLQSSNPYDYCRIDLSPPGEEEKIFVFLESVFPRVQLVIAGAGHIGKVLCHLGKLLDFEVTVIDDRIEFANSENLPDADRILVEEVGKAMQLTDKTSDTYIVIVTRGHNDDADALKQCIGSSSAYIGMIGSRTKIEKMHRSFVQNGWATEEQWASIHAPVGLDILSKSVEEIAISIAAELVLERNKKYSRQ